MPPLDRTSRETTANREERDAAKVPARLETGTPRPVIGPPTLKPVNSVY